MKGWDLVARGGQKGEVGRGQQDLSSLEPEGSDYVRVVSVRHVVCVCVRALDFPSTQKSILSYFSQSNSFFIKVDQCIQYNYQIPFPLR